MAVQEDVMPTRDIRSRLILDGEQEFNRSLKEIERSARVLDSEMGKLEAQFKLSGDELEFYTNKGDLLTRQIEQQEAKVEALQQAVADAAKKYGDAAKQTDGYRIKLNNAEKKLLSMQKVQQETAASLKELEEAQQSFGDELEQGGEKGKAYVNKMQNAFSGFSAAASGDMQGLLENIVGLGGAMQGASGETSEAAGDIIGEMGGVVAAVGAVVMAIGEIGTEIVEQRRTIEREVAKIEIALDIDTEQAEEVADIAKELYSQRFTDSFDEAVQDLMVMKSYMKDLADISLERVTKQAEVLAKTTNADVDAIARAASVLRERFGASAEEAMDLLSAAVKKNPFRAGELLDAVQEYSVQFQQMGKDAEEMTAIFANGLENNVESLDKLADAYKELNIRAKDNSDATREALQGLGLDADRTMAAVASGGDVASKAIDDIIQRLQKMPNALKQNEIGVALMGSQWEDLGAKAFLAGAETQKTMEQVIGTAQKNVQRFSQEATTATEAYYRRIEVSAGEGTAKFVKFVEGMITPMNTVVRNIVGEMYSGIDEAEQTGEDMGKSLIDGTVAGMQGNSEKLNRESKNVFQKMVEGIKTYLGIHSPSKLYEQIGMYSGLGFVHGFEKQMEEAQQSMNVMLSPSFEKTTAAARQNNTTYNDNSQIIMRVDDVETFVAIKKRMESERVSKRMGYTGR